MSWQSVSSLSSKHAKKSGIAGTLDAMRICQHVDTLYPGQIKAISLKNGFLKVGFTPENRMIAELFKGDILRSAQVFAKEQNLPFPERIGLTEQRELC